MMIDDDEAIHEILLMRHLGVDVIEMFTEICACISASMPTFADRGCRVVSATDPLAINSVFLTGAATCSFK
jgi:hypothetical protein